MFQLERVNPIRHRARCVLGLTNTRSVMMTRTPRTNATRGNARDGTTGYLSGSNLPICGRVDWTHRPGKT